MLQYDNRKLTNKENFTFDFISRIMCRYSSVQILYVEPFIIKFCISILCINKLQLSKKAIIHKAFNTILYNFLSSGFFLIMDEDLCFGNQIYIYSER